MYKRQAAEAESTVAAVESTEAAEAESTEAESTETAAEVESKGTITVAATPVPHAEILEAAKDLMAAEGWDLEIVEFTDYVQPNEVVESGDVDANYFQHVNYLNSYNAVSYTHLRAHETRHDLVCRLLLEKKKFARLPATLP